MIYVDSCLVIYAVEDAAELGDRTRALLASSDDTFAIGPLVMLEALVHPLRSLDHSLTARYESIFSRFILLDPELKDYLHAAELRAANPGLKTVDALHLSAAQLSGCTTLWTNDRRLAASSGDFAVDVING